MGYFAPKQTSSFKLAPVGLHKARMFGFIDLGTHDNRDPKTGEIKPARQVEVQFELHGKNAEPIEGKPPIYTKRLKFSMHEKATLRALIEALTNNTNNGNVYGDGIDIEPAFGRFCQLNLVATTKADGTEGRKIASMMPVDPDAPTPEAVNPLRLFSLAPDMFDAEAFQALPERLRKLISESPEFAELTGQTVMAESDEIPV